jgi:hypothetical protein
MILIIEGLSITIQPYRKRRPSAMIVAQQKRLLITALDSTKVFIGHIRTANSIK